MIKKSLWVLCVLLVLLPLSAGADYSFPTLGVRLAVQEGWTVLLRDDLDEQRAWIERTGADIEALRADYAANHTVFEVFLPNGAQVSLSVSETEETAAWGSIERLTQAEVDAYISRYANPPYRHAEWCEDAPGFLRCGFVMEAGGVEVSFARLTTIWQGALYTLTAAGVGVGMEALHGANATVLAALDFVGSRADAPLGSYTPPPLLPEVIVDDGRVTPVSLVDFTGITDQDQTAIVVSALPGTELLLQTQGDTLRGVAGADGRHKFTLSTRRENTYAYTLTATAEGRNPSRLDITLERKLSKEVLEGNYRRGAMVMDAMGYGQVAASPSAYRGKTVTFRGRVEGFAEINGFPSALVYTSNPAAGEWLNPLWVIFMQPFEAAEFEMLSGWGDIRGDTLPYREGGEALTAPVVIGRLFSK